MSGFEGDPASADGDDDGGGDREGTPGGKDGPGGESMCRPRGSRGRLKCYPGGGRRQTWGRCLESGREGTPADHKDRPGRSGGGSAGSTAWEERERTGSGWAGGGIWSAFGSL